MINFIMALQLGFSIGVCDTSNINCYEGTMARVFVQQEIEVSSKHKIYLDAELEHISHPGDGEFEMRGDRGVEYFWLTVTKEF